jgi:hypothetical protein
VRGFIAGCGLTQAQRFYLPRFFFTVSQPSSASSVCAAGFSEVCAGVRGRESSPPAPQHGLADGVAAYLALVLLAGRGRRTRFGRALLRPARAALVVARALLTSRAFVAPSGGRAVRPAFLAADTERVCTRAHNTRAQSYRRPGGR